MSQLIWAPELHEIDGKWYIYFAATHTHDLDALGMFQHRMFVLECAGQRSADRPLAGKRPGGSRLSIPSPSMPPLLPIRGNAGICGRKNPPHIEGNSNLYLAEMANPWTLKGEPVMLSKPEFDWECRGFKVNEGPAVLMHGDKLFISYSASATDENYCMGLLWIDRQADPLQPANWHKAPQPVFRTSYENRQYGPGHNSFTQTPEGEDVLVYHARNYTEIEGDPLYDPNRHTRLKLVSWREDGMPDFGIPPADTL
ncbi:alpha-L-arabinofuranosidase II [Klebsiella pneumoniae subsp. ozaenae]|uniref:Alpha-L-arabinofuranosidase II n=1 Tax=Klebsiella pneumoniae subsp. ozaenae TaxID=574 RepID=A0A378C1A3_KLEPO|nr:alpha-L-arabinofuranosidase II [Klebsiella pneumoniae subsp. ozaenae]